MKKTSLLVAILATIGTFYPVITNASSIGPVTGYALPRFVSTKSMPINVRTGPGRRYPVKVVFKKKVPIKIIDEYKDWRKIRDWDGEEGWVHRLLLESRRRGLVMQPITGLYKYQKDIMDNKLIARLGKEVDVLLHKCSLKWCFVTVPRVQRKGYILRADLWGVLKGEIFNK